MHWNCGAKGAALLLIYGGIAWFFETPMTETTMTETALISEQVLQACKEAPDARYLGEPEFVRDPPPSETEVLRRGAIRVVWKGDDLWAYTTRSEYDDGTSVPQLDYGRVSGVYEDGTGGLIAIGDQTSYRVTVELVEGRARFGRRVAFPKLSGQPCGLVSHLIGTCWPAQAVFSHELRAGLIEGFNRWGGESLFAVGLREGERETLLEAPEGGPLWYWYDVPGSSGVLFSTQSRIKHFFITIIGGGLFNYHKDDTFLFFDGVRMHSCPPQFISARRCAERREAHQFESFPTADSKYSVAAPID